jgi:hypothetical protein
MGRDSDTAETYRVMREASQAKRASNRNFSADLLRKAGVEFESKNRGAHLIVRHRDMIVDFWPGTGKWIPRGGGIPKRGVHGLLKYLKAGE